LSNATTTNDTAISVCDETQRNSANEERISQQISNCSYLSKRNPNDNNSNNTVKRKDIFIL
jgi:hypothetical protein